MLQSANGGRDVGRVSPTPPRAHIRQHHTGVLPQRAVFMAVAPGLASGGSSGGVFWGPNVVGGEAVAARRLVSRPDRTGGGKVQDVSASSVKQTDRFMGREHLAMAASAVLNGAQSRAACAEEAEDEHLAAVQERKRSQPPLSTGIIGQEVAQRAERDRQAPSGVRAGDNGASAGEIVGAVKMSTSHGPCEVGASVSDADLRALSSQVARRRAEGAKAAAESTFFNVLRTLVSSIRLELVKGWDEATLFVPPREGAADRFYPDTVLKEHPAYFEGLARRREALARQRHVSQAASSSAVASMKDDRSLRYVFDRRPVEVAGRRKASKGKAGGAKREHRPPGALARAGGSAGAGAGLSWARMQELAMVQKRQRCEHVLSVLQEELSKEVQRQGALAACPARKLGALRWQVARERAEAGDWIMRILQEYRLVSATVMVDYLRETLSKDEAVGVGELRAIRDGRRVGRDASGRARDLLDLVSEDLLREDEDSRQTRREAARWEERARRARQRGRAGRGTFDAVAAETELLALTRAQEAAHEREAKAARDAQGKGGAATEPGGRRPGARRVEGSRSPGASRGSRRRGGIRPGAGRGAWAAREAARPEAEAVLARAAVAMRGEGRGASAAGEQDPRPRRGSGGPGAVPGGRGGGADVRGANAPLSAASDSGRCEGRPAAVRAGASLAAQGATSVAAGRRAMSPLGTGEVPPPAKAHITPGSLAAMAGMSDVASPLLPELDRVAERVRRLREQAAALGPLAPAKAAARATGKSAAFAANHGDDNEEAAWLMDEDDSSGLQVNLMDKLTLRRKEDGTMVQPPMRRTRTDVEAAIEATHDTVNVKDTVGLMLKLLKQQAREPPNGRYSHLIGRWMQFG